MIRYVIASSSSKGNATLIYSENTLIQIDMGVTLTALNKALSLTPFELKDIKALLITHEHSDHVKGLSLVAYQKLKLPIFAGESTIYSGINVIEEENSFEIGDFTIIPLKASHDASHPLGFILINGNTKLVYMTDTGYVPEEDLPYMMNADYYIFESNHDVRMLKTSDRPLVLKKRILSDYGHLSNLDSATYMADLVGDKTKEISLAHLSLDCNTPKKALDTYKKVFTKKGLDFERYNVRTAPAFEPLVGGDK